MPYRVYYKRKSDGRSRRICIPDPELKKAQRALLSHLETRFSMHPSCHGFKRGSDPITNARVHLGADFLLCMDIQDFFDSITYVAMTKYLAGLVDEDQLTTQESDDILDLGFIRPFNCLPQGAPTSPFLANMFSKPMDKKLFTLAKRNGMKYTRYADDLTFSGPDRALLQELIPQVETILVTYGLRLNATKTTLHGHDQRMDVTGVVINDHPTAGRRTRDRVRTALHRVEIALREGQLTLEQAEEIAGMPMDRLTGLAAHAAHVDPGSRGRHRIAVDLTRQMTLTDMIVARGREETDVGPLPETAPGPADRELDEYVEAGRDDLSPLS